MQLFVKCPKRSVTIKMHLDIALPAARYCGVAQVQMHWCCCLSATLLLNHSLQYCCCNPDHLVAEKHRCSIMRSLLPSGVNMATSGYVWTYVYSTVALLNPSCMNNACSDSCKCRHESVRQCRQTYIQINRQTDRMSDNQAHTHTSGHTNLLLLLLLLSVSLSLLLSSL